MGSSRARARTHAPCIGRWILNHCTTREVREPRLDRGSLLFIFSIDQKPSDMSWWSALSSNLKAGNSTLSDPNSGIQTPSLVFSRSRAFHLGTIDHTQEFATRASSTGFGDQMPPPNPSVNRATDSDASVMGTFPQVLSDQDPHRDTSVIRDLASIPLAARAPPSAPQ